MNCYECGGTYIEKSDLLEVDDKYVGRISIEGIHYYICDNCKDILYTEEILRAIEESRDSRIKKLVRDFPLDDFISTNETASLLGISRQALHKNRRISKGFIYHANIGNLIVFLKKSVIQFKETGDGRFPLSTSIPRSYTRVFHNKTFTSQYLGRPSILFGQSHYKDYGKLKERHHAKR